MRSQINEQDLRQEFDQLEKTLSDSSVYQKDNYPQLAKRFKELTEIIHLLDKRKILNYQQQDAEALTKNSDSALAVLAETELEEILSEKQKLQQALEQLFVSNEDQKISGNCLLEIRAGVGGAEACLFATDLQRMYLKFIEKKSWKIEVISQSLAESGGYKEIISEITGKQAYSQLQFESGVHRVQRIPSTESQGRIHTSTVSIAVLPIAKETDLTLDANDLKIDTYRSSGPGGQGVNKTDSAVRVTHLPTKLVVICQDSRSQLKNKEKALEVLRSRLLEKQIAETEAKTSSRRKKLIGRAFRNEKIRTYNFPQDRLTDHRIAKNFSNLADILNGQLQPLINQLTDYETQ
ncbi:MAG: peptide chain release factor 1 [Candidatus Saccharibacteria bacterium]|nr:peptide chain release factor 1 [Candidatus Saccharibacteria bacterium]